MEWRAMADAVRITNVENWYVCILQKPEALTISSRINNN